MRPDDTDRPPERDSRLPTLGEWEPAEAIPVAMPALPALPVFCRRCGETSEPVANCCPWCGAWVVGEPPRVTPVYDVDDEPEDDWHDDWRDDDYREPIRETPSLVMPVLVVGVSYVLLIGSLFVVAILAVIYGVSEMEEMMPWMAGVGIADGIMTVIALILVWKFAKQTLPKGTMGLTWAAALPVLFALLCLNIAYITFLRELLKPLGVQEGPRIPLSFLTVMVICVQPAIVEELFFRQMTLGVFRKAMNLHLAVWLTAAMFAFAHLGQILAMPYLFLAGGVFGYARAYGGLSLAMIMHFIHNFVVIVYESQK